MAILKKHLNFINQYWVVNSKEEAEALFNGLYEGGIVEMPIGDGPWCAYFGAFRDKYGVEWMIECAE